MKHTPTPWEYEVHSKFSSIKVQSHKDGHVSHIAQVVPTPGVDNAAFIVKACNNFEPLMEAMTNVCNVFADGLEGTIVEPEADVNALKRLEQALINAKD